MTTTTRKVKQVISGQATSDGAGVSLTRYIGTQELNTLDPFLMLDRFSSDEPKDYIAGFPPHPHRGFETVTYLMNGRMRHEDSVGNNGVIEAGGVQWMTAGRGVIHSEMPEQQDGLLDGFQLWINLPAANKMDAPAYQEFPAGRMALESRAHGVELRVVAGTTSLGTSGPVSQPLTDPLYMDVRLPEGIVFNEPLAAGHNAFVFVMSGKLSIGDDSISAEQMAVLDDGEQLSVRAHAGESRFLLIAARPLAETVARGGPFVMNSKEQIRQAFSDYENGDFLHAGSATRRLSENRARSEGKPF